MWIYHIASCYTSKTSNGNSGTGLTISHCDPILLHNKSTVNNKIEKVISSNNNFYDNGKGHPVTCNEGTGRVAVGGQHYTSIEIKFEFCNNVYFTSLHILT
jgi:hypothetical protein